MDKAVEELQEELKLLKNEIKETLTDVREYLLTNVDNPFAQENAPAKPAPQARRAPEALKAEAAPPAALAPQSPPSPATPSPTPASPLAAGGTPVGPMAGGVMGGLPGLPSLPFVGGGMPGLGALPNLGALLDKAIGQDKPAGADKPGGPDKATTGLGPMPTTRRPETGTPEPAPRPFGKGPGGTGPSNEAPRMDSPRLGKHVTNGHGLSGPAARDAGRGDDRDGADHEEAAAVDAPPRPATATTAKLDLTVMAAITPWLEDGIRALGRRRMKALLDIYESVGGISREAHETLAQMLTLQDVEPAKSKATLHDAMGYLAELDDLLWRVRQDPRRGVMAAMFRRRPPADER